jgi:hypothetical protein
MLVAPRRSPQKLFFVGFFPGGECKGQLQRVAQFAIEARDQGRTVARVTDWFAATGTFGYEPAKKST